MPCATTPPAATQFVAPSHVRGPVPEASEVPIPGTTHGLPSKKTHESPSFINGLYGLSENKKVYMSYEEELEDSLV